MPFSVLPFRFRALPAALALGATAILAAPPPAAPAPIAPRPPADAAWARLPPHPRLFATAAEWRQLRQRLATAADPVTTGLFAHLRTRAEAILRDPPVSLRPRDRGALSATLLEPAREFQRRILALAAMARLTDDPRFHARAVVELRRLADLPDWNPAVFLDTAEATLAVAVGYDWLHDSLAPADRDTLATALAEKGLRASFDSPPKMLSWVRGTNNWNQVGHGALVAGALALAERDPALARRTVERAVAELRSAARAYAPEGVYPEGPMYWSYGTTFHVALLSALETALGDRCGLDLFPGFLGTADYLNQVTAPSDDTFNYADSSSHRSFEPALFWFARRLRQPAVIQWELARLSAAASPAASARFRSRHLPLALLWWDPALLTLPSPPLPLHWKGDGPVPIAVHRSAWSDPRAVYLALKGGRAGVSHGHMDAGSFILEADGIRWAVDPGGQNYGTAYRAGIDAGLWRFTQDSPRWTIFRLGADAHNLLRFDGAPPRVDGPARLLLFSAAASGPYTQLDLTATIGDRVHSAHRGVRLLPDRRVVFQDEWTTAARPAQVAWQWLTHAAVTIETGGARLRQRGESLYLRVLEPAAATLAIEDPATHLQAQDEPTPGLRRLVVHTATPAHASGRLIIIAEPGSAPASPAPPVLPLASW